MRSIGGSVSAAVIGVVLAQMTTDFGGIALPAESGFRVAMLIGCGVGIGASILAFLIPVRAAAAQPEPDTAPPAVPEASAARA